MDKEKPVGWRKDPEEKVTQQLKVYVTEQEEIRLKKYADLVNMSFSSFARAILTEEDIEFEPHELKRIRFELNKIGVNLNQLARKANESDRLPTRQKLQAIHKEIVQTLGEL